jgi:hypothetical protein
VIDELNRLVNAIPKEQLRQCLEELERALASPTENAIYKIIERQAVVLIKERLKCLNTSAHPSAR